MDPSLLPKVFGSWVDPLTRWGMYDGFGKLIKQLNHLYSTSTVYPEKSKVFRALREVIYNDLRVVMLFQDPYHDGSATGIAVGNEPPPGSDYMSPTLRILMEEWQNDPDTGDTFNVSLIPWCRQGVLMLNSSLTVKEAEPMSHSFMWKNWTEKFLVSLSMERKDLVWILLGRKAQAWEEHILNGTVVKAPHPAAEVYAKGNAGFYGSRIFTKVNNHFRKIGKPIIEW